MSLQFDQLNNQLIVNDASNANAPIVLQASGTGATQAQLATSTTTGGNARGIYVTDLQKSRNAATQVANGNYSVIVGGSRNTVPGLYSFIGGGFNNYVYGSVNGYSAVVGGGSNQAVGEYSFVGCGANNQATGDYSFVGGGGDAVTATNRNTASGTGSVVVGGLKNTASASYSTIAGGSGNSASNQYTFIGGGLGNQTSGIYSASLGGNTNIINQNYAILLGGAYATTRGIIGNVVIPACYNLGSQYGASQKCFLNVYTTTTTATATVLTSDGSAATTSNQVTLPNNSAYYFKGRIIAGVTGAGNTSAWTFEGAIKRGVGVGTTAIVGTVNTSLVARDAGASTWSFTATADTTNGGLAITVTGQASTTIGWVCTIETTELAQ